MSLLWFLPLAALPLVVAGLGILVMVGIVPFKRALAIIVGLALLPALDPLVEAMIAALPWWLLLLMLFGGTLALLRAALELMIGHRAASHTVGILTADVIRFVFLLPFRLVGVLVRALW